jgi:ABC-type Fe3+/spermidine/putrescine transport system ATPase subunit
MARVRIDGLAKHYGDVAALRGIDLEVAAGEFVVLLGPSGCGKTTTLRCVAGLEPLTAGEIAIGDSLVSTARFALAPERREVGMVFQSHAVWPHLSVGENIAFGLRLKKLSAAEIGGRIDRVLALVGLAGYAERMPGQLSGGQQQRVALARAIVLEPKVLLFDEPLSNLDAKLRERMRLEVRQIQKRLGTTSIYVTHDQEEAIVVADRIVLMDEGRIVQAGTPFELYTRPKSRFAAEFVGVANIMPGEVIAAGAGTRVKLANGAAVVSADTGFAAGEAVDVVCRPEHVSVSAEARDGENVIAGDVRATVFLGNTADVYVQAGGLELRAQLSPPAIWPQGQAVHMHLPPDRVILLPRRTAR